MTPKAKKIVLVEWVDARSFHDVSYFEEDLENETLINAKTVGFLVKEDEEKVIVSSFLFWEKGVHGNIEAYKTIHIIPRCCIKDMKELKV